ncbi:MAG: PAS domain-containing sensor histidine kinase, partial [Bdellovibrionales bacterium]|nr:PAS domain-containing sensor histidine kinase [Bdellovibrionales bacterium]
IEIEDSGSGIPEKNLEKIWIPFFTTKEVGKGTGLGLHICKDIIQQHAGRLTVENVAGSGAKFSIVLPLKPGQ